MLKTDSAAAERCCAALPHPPGPGSGSRRRRLWELGTHAHCPVIGVCLSLEAMRRLAQRCLVLSGDEDDYTLHCALVTAAERRNKVSEALQRELEQRYALDLRQAAQAKSLDALMAWWRTRAAQGEIAGPLWATLTHPRCESWLEMRVLGQVHMLQHQVGAAQRVDLQRHRELIAEHRALSAEYGAAQRRTTEWALERGREQAAWERERMQLRAESLALRTRLAQAEEEAARWRRLSPELPERLALQQRLQEQTERAQALQRELNRLQQTAPAQHVEAALPAAAPAAAVPAAPPQLEHRVVLCVGGRSSTVPQYRRAVEDCGAQFLHHDGGTEHRPTQLEPQLAAADLVICQTGCISHDAYWRVKDHCKRHGKRCVFIETPSRSAFERALQQAALQGQPALPE